MELRLGAPERFVVLGEGSSNGVDVAGIEAALPSVDERAALRKRLGLDGDVPVVGFVGRLTEDKGVSVLSEALRRLTQQNLTVQVLLVGSTEGEGEGAAFADTGSRVSRTGFVSDPERYYAVMDILCLPTLREGFPNVVLEAAAAGVPTVTTDATGAVDSVVDNTTGLVVPVRDARALAAALEQLATDRGLRESMGAAARERARVLFGRDVVWAAQEGFYRQLLAARR